MAEIQNDLIFDVGMHKGYDTAFYLAKGFRVVAIEANPVLAAGARETFARELDEGRLTIVEKAVSDSPGEVSFFVFDEKSDWGTIDPRMAHRNEGVGIASRSIQVESVNLRSILEEHGTPYYLKVDIEGADLHCIEALRGKKVAPPYVSIEAGMEGRGNSFEELDCLSEAGYTHFQVMNMDEVHHQKCPFPAREGEFVEHKFGPQTSGLFGKELPGPWKTLREAKCQFRRLSREFSLFSPGGTLRHTLFYGLYLTACRAFRRNHIGWYDVHATFSPHQGEVAPQNGVNGEMKN